MHNLFFIFAVLLLSPTLKAMDEPASEPLIISPVARKLSPANICKLIPQTGREELYMIKADPKSDPAPRAYAGVSFLILADEPTPAQYIILLEDDDADNLVEQGWGLLGLKVDGSFSGYVFAFHPKVEQAAHYLYQVIAKKKRNHYQFGLLLGYYEPNVYAWCFGTEAAKKAYPDLRFGKELQESYPEKDAAFMRRKHKRGLENLDAEIRALVLHERDPLDPKFNVQTVDHDSDNEECLTEGSERVQHEENCFWQLWNSVILCICGGGTSADHFYSAPN